MVPACSAAAAEKIAPEKRTPKSHNGQTVVHPSQALGSIPGANRPKPATQVPVTESQGRSSRATNTASSIHVPCPVRSWRPSVSGRAEDGRPVGKRITAARQGKSLESLLISSWKILCYVNDATTEPSSAKGQCKRLVWLAVMSGLYVGSEKRLSGIDLVGVASVRP